VSLMIKKISLALLVFFGLTNCNQSSYATGSTDARNALVLIIMPEQNCKEKEMGRILIDEKILHPAHKECYYK
jgi:hypothetical protein